jgi:MYXO-CTERM domain-containing protein
MRRTHVLLILFLAVLVVTPTVAAQGSIKIEAQWDKSGLVLPESGRADVPLIVNAKVSGTNCAAEETVGVALKLEPFMKWAGASMLPPQVTFKIPAGPTTAEQTISSEQDPLLNVAWDTEGAPRFGAQQTYVVVIRAEDVQTNGGPCLPEMRVEGTRSDPLTVQMADRPVQDEPVDCTVDPYQPSCATTSAEPAPPAPAAGPLVLLLVVALAAGIRRRFG